MESGEQGRRPSPAVTHHTAAATAPSFSFLLDQLAAQLAPERRRHEAARELADLICDTLRLSPPDGFQVLEVHPFGSMARGTALGAFDDYDVMVVFSVEHLRRGGRPLPRPSDVLGRLNTWLATMGDALFGPWMLTIREQAHSLGLSLEREDHDPLWIDLVPALASSHPGVVRIPQTRPRHAWIPARPFAMRDRLDRLAASCPSVRPAIRLLKGWKYAQGIWFPSYGLELLVTAGLQKGQSPTTQELVKQVFTRFAVAAPDLPLRLGRACRPVPMTLIDPWTRANVLAKGDDEQRRRLADASREAREKLAGLEQALLEGVIDCVRASLQQMFIGEQRNLRMDGIRERQELSPFWR